jgi:hypothetical protein
MSHLPQHAPKRIEEFSAPECMQDNIHDFPYSLYKMLYR